MQVSKDLKADLVRLGNLQSAGHYQEASEKIEEIKEEAHLIPGFHYLCGLIYQGMGEVDEAHKSYSKELKNNRKFYLAYINKGVLYYNEKKVQEAIGCFKLAMLVAPTEPLPYFNLGNVMRYCNRLREAVVYFKRAVAIDDTYLDAWKNLASVYRSLNLTEETVEAYQKVLKYKPECPTTLHLLDAMTEQKQTSSPTCYVTRLFDAYADKYDQHLVGVLKYSCHTILANKLMENLPDKVEKGLDLGCGTGLMVEAFEQMEIPPIQWTGVDLSQKMIDRAQGRKIYHALHCGDIQGYFHGIPDETKFDVITASDMCPYLGCLKDFIQGIYKVSHPRSLAAFSVELLDSDDRGFRVNRFGRFQHSYDYVEKVVKSADLRVVSFSEEAIRMNDDRPVLGGLFVIGMNCPTS